MRSINGSKEIFRTKSIIASYSLFSIRYLLHFLFPIFSPQSADYQMKKRRCKYLKGKLNHIKKMVSDYDRRAWATLWGSHTPVRDETERTQSGFLALLSSSVCFSERGASCRGRRLRRHRGPSEPVKLCKGCFVLRKHRKQLFCLALSHRLYCECHLP